MQIQDKDIAFIKFPTTPYLVLPKDRIARHDKLLSYSDACLFYSNDVIIEEKIDGANLGISFSTEGEMLFQNRGNYLIKPFKGQWKPLEEWANRKGTFLFDILYDRYILFGEWCFLTHSVFYNSLPDWFIAFDIFDRMDNCFLSVERRNHFAEQMGIKTVPFIAKERIMIETIDKYIGKSAFGDELCEGIYLRMESDDKLIKRAKYVRNSFSQTIDVHWSKKSIHKNQIAHECHTD